MNKRSNAFYRDSIQALSHDHGVDIILGSVAEDEHQTNRMWNAAFLASADLGEAFQAFMERRPTRYQG